jgi:hypothetical protein
MLDRVLGRQPGDRPPVTLDADELRPGGEDVWKALRF